MKGNEVLAEAAMRAGCRFFFGYPITPQTELAAYMAKKLPLIGGTFLQAESEVAAINMVYGAAAAGARVMTSSSSPGVSLKGEGVSYMAGADCPGVIVNVERGGPGLGGIQPSQSDYFQATRALGHGDFYMPVLAPSTVQEMADLIYLAFDLADEYRTPAMILADGMIGQMMEPVTLPPERDPKTLPAKPWATTGTQGEREHNVVNSLYLSPEKLEDTNRERFERYEEIKAKHQRQELMMCDDAEIVVVAFGAASRIARTAVRDARAKGIKCGLLRPITLWPFPDQGHRPGHRERRQASSCPSSSTWARWSRTCAWPSTAAPTWTSTVAPAACCPRPRRSSRRSRPSRLARRCSSRQSPAQWAAPASPAPQEQLRKG